MKKLIAIAVFTLILAMSAMAQQVSTPPPADNGGGLPANSQVGQSYGDDRVIIYRQGLPPVVVNEGTSQPQPAPAPVVTPAPKGTP